MAKGTFITFEGPDGSGKTTQLSRLAIEIEKRGLPVIRTREPGGTKISDQIRQMILDPGNREMLDETEILLYAASRAQHVREVILPALKEGKVVICDRFVDASMAYQGYGLNQSLEDIKKINHFATGGLQPDRTYLLDVSVETGRERMINRNGNDFQGLDRIEQREWDYHNRVREGFLTLTTVDQERFKLIDGERDPESIAREILQDYFSRYESI